MTKTPVAEMSLLTNEHVIRLSQIDRSQALPRKDWTMLQPKTAKIALLMAVLAMVVVLVARQ